MQLLDLLALVAKKKKAFFFTFLAPGDSVRSGGLLGVYATTWVNCHLRRSLEWGD